MRTSIFLSILCLIVAGVLASPANAATFNVSDAAGLQTALATAAANGEADVIQLARGTYTGTFTFTSTEGLDITILGGFDPTFSSRILDPANTVLDATGDSTHVMNIQNDNGGSIYIEGITAENSSNGSGILAWTQYPNGVSGDITINKNILTGNQGGQGGGLYVLTIAPGGTSGDILVSNNLIIDNSDALRGGGINASHDPGGKTVLLNNVIAGNSATSQGGGGWFTGHATYLINNTIVDNTAPANSGGGIYCYVNGNAYEVDNNIIRGNTGGDIWFDNIVAGVKNGYNNNYTSLGGSWTSAANNLDLPSLFIGSGDYHLSLGSPCIDAGFNTAPELPTQDFDGNPRKIDASFKGTATVDIGADEFIPMLSLNHGHDFTGNGKSDVSVWRPGNGRWYIKGGAWPFWGGPGDICTHGDYNGDTITDIAVWKPTTGRWYIKGGSWPFWGDLGDIPVPGDYDGNGTTDVAVWRPSTGRWYIQGQAWPIWGSQGDVPIPKDYDGDGDTDPAVWRASTGTWYIKDQAWKNLGQLGDIPVPGDYDGDGAAEAAVFRVLEGKWYIDGMSTVVWGEFGDLPVPGDYDGDGDTDIAVWRPSTGRWYIRGMAWPFWGSAGDLPLVR